MASSQVQELLKEPFGAVFGGVTSESGSFFVGGGGGGGSS